MVLHHEQVFILLDHMRWLYHGQVFRKLWSPEITLRQVYVGPCTPTHICMQHENLFEDVMDKAGAWIDPLVPDSYFSDTAFIPVNAECSHLQLH
jgi:hypothetical protein